MNGIGSDAVFNPTTTEVFVFASVPGTFPIPHSVVN